MNTENTHDAQLSPEGRQRRALMLGELQHAMESHHAHKRRRRTFTSAGALALGITIGALSWLSLAQRTTQIGPPLAQQSQPNSADHQAQPPGVQVNIISTSTNIIEQYAATSSPQRITVIESDDELLRTLAEYGRPTGLIRINGEVRLTDLQVAQRHQTSPDEDSTPAPHGPSL